MGCRWGILTFTNYIQGFLSVVCKIPCKIGIMNQSNTSSRATPVRVLIVDDHLGTATTLARAIAQVGPGLEVIPATSGQEALDRVKYVSADILITDMIM